MLKFCAITFTNSSALSIHIVSPRVFNLSLTYISQSTFYRSPLSWAELVEYRLKKTK